MTPSETVRALREEIWDAGFRPIGVSNPEADHPHAGKAPFEGSWTELARRDPPASIGSVRLDALNTGLLCDGLRAIDIDVDDVALVQRIRATAIMMFGEAPMRVRDNSPRCLLLYRAAAGEPGKRKLEGKHGLVEVLGHGQQFVAYGRHPTGAQLRWMPEPPHASSRDSLPAVTEDQISAFFAQVAVWLEAKEEKNLAASAVRAEDPADLRALVDALVNAGAANWRHESELPAGVLDKLNGIYTKSQKARDRWHGLCDDLIERGKDHSGSGMDMSLAALLKHAGLPPFEIALALLVYEHGSAHSKEKHPTPATRLRYVARTALRAGQGAKEAGERPGPASQDPGANGGDGDAAEVGLTEDDVALAFAAEHAGSVAFDHTLPMWFTFTEGRWVRDERGRVFNTVRAYVRAARFAAQGDPKSMAKIAFAAAVERAVKTDPRVAVSQEVWDSDPWLLGVPGGVVDLRTGDVLDGHPEQRISRSTRVAPAEPGTPFPLWQQFLDQATGEDEELQSFLKRLAGYFLTGDVSEEMLAFIYGPGGNGKGVFIGVLTAILAEYAVAMPIEAFVAKSRLNAEYYRAQMAGARLVTASETEAGATWAEATIKELTGNEAPVSARHPHGRPFTYRPQFKLCIVGNHAPKLQGRSPAMERRLRVLPFNRKPENPDPDLKVKLAAEYPAILRWAIEGCLEWQEARLGTTTAIKDASKDYFEDQDAFGQWLDERTIRDSSLTTRTADLLKDFNSWSQDQGADPVSSNAFAELIDRTPGLSRVRSKVARMVRGIGLKAADDYRGDNR